MNLNIYKNELHYYIGLLRTQCQDNKTITASKSTQLGNIIRTMRFSRHDWICKEDFSFLDFATLDLRNIHFSLHGEYACDFSNSIIYEENFFPGGIQNTFADSSSSRSIVLVSHSTKRFYLMDTISQISKCPPKTYVFEAVSGRQVKSFEVPFSINPQNGEEFFVHNAVKLDVYSNNIHSDYIAYLYSNHNFNKSATDLNYYILLYNVNTDEQTLSPLLSEDIFHLFHMKFLRRFGHIFDGIINKLAEKIKKEPTLDQNIPELFLRVIEECSILAHKRLVKSIIKAKHHLEYNILDCDPFNNVVIDSNGNIYKGSIDHMFEELIKITSLDVDSQIIENAFLLDNSRMCLVHTEDGRYLIYEIKGDSAVHISDVRNETKTICDICFSQDDKYIDVWCADEFTRIDLIQERFVHSKRNNMLFQIDRTGMVHYCSDTADIGSNFLRRRKKSIYYFKKYLRDNGIELSQEISIALQSPYLLCAALTPDNNYMLIYNHNHLKYHNSIIPQRELSFFSLNDSFPAPEICSEISKLHVVSVSFSQNGQFCAISDTNGIIYLCDSLLQSVLKKFYCVANIFISGCDFNCIQAPKILKDIFEQYSLVDPSSNQRRLGALGELNDDYNSKAFPLIKNDERSLFGDKPQLLNYFFSNDLNKLYIVVFFPDQDEDTTAVTKCYANFYKYLYHSISIVSNEIEYELLYKEYRRIHGIYPSAFGYNGDVYLVIKGFYLEETQSHYILYRKSIDSYKTGIKVARIVGSFEDFKLFFNLDEEEISLTERVVSKEKILP